MEQTVFKKEGGKEARGQDIRQIISIDIKVEFKIGVELKKIQRQELKSSRNTLGYIEVVSG